MNRNNADVTHQVSSEIAIEAEVVLDDRGHTQTVTMLVNHGIDRYMEKTLIIPSYKAIVRTHLEYCIQA